jgi:hypothetical protein
VLCLSGSAAASLSLKVSLGTWSWIAGPSARDANGGNERNPGTKFISSSSVTPNGVRGSCAALDEGYNVIFVYGGCRSDCCANLKDVLWVFNITSNQWAWVSGGSTDGTGTVPKYGSLNTAYSVTSSMSVSNPGERVHCAAAAFTDGDGRFYMYSGWGTGATGAGKGLLC